MDLLEITDGKTKVHKHFLDDGSEDENQRDPLIDGNCIQPGIQYRIAGNQSEGPLYRVITTDSEGNQTTTVNTGALTNVQAVLASPLNGQFYVIGNPSDLLGNAGQRTIAPRTAAFTLENTASIQTGGKDDKQGTRRATHNEVERRRRDNINNWIMKLGKLIPDSGADNSQGGKHTQSKGGILAKACEYLADLRNQGSRLAESQKETEEVRADNEQLKLRLDQLQRENQVLRQQLQEHGIMPATSEDAHHINKFSL